MQIRVHTNENVLSQLLRTPEGALDTPASTPGYDVPFSESRHLETIPGRISLYVGEIVCISDSEKNRPANVKMRRTDWDDIH